MFEIKILVHIRTLIMMRMLAHSISMSDEKSSPQPFLPSRANLAFDDTLNSTSANSELSPGQANDALEMLTSFSLLHSDVRERRRH